MSFPPAHRPARRAEFRPRFTLSLLYVAGFFLLYALLLVLPELLHVLKTVPTGPEQTEVAQRVVRQVARVRLGVALAAAVATTGIGAYTRALPGLRGP